MESEPLVQANDEKLEALKQKIQERKNQLLKSKLSKKILGSDKKLKAQIQKSELKAKASNKFIDYMQSITDSSAGYVVVDQKKADSRRERNDEAVSTENHLAGAFAAGQVAGSPSLTRFTT
jgi:hypothetical protein